MLLELALDPSKAHLGKRRIGLVREKNVQMDRWRFSLPLSLSHTHKHTRTLYIDIYKKDGMCV